MDRGYMFRFCKKKRAIYQNAIVEIKSSHIFIEEKGELPADHLGKDWGGDEKHAAGLELEEETLLWMEVDVLVV